MAVFLEVNPFASRLGRDKELHAAFVEQLSCVFPSLTDAAHLVVAMDDVVRSVVTVDERHAALAEAANQLRHEEGLRRLVLREEQHRATREARLDEGEDLRDLRLPLHALCSHEQL